MNNKYTIKKINESLYGIGEFYHNEKVISYLLVGKDKCFLVDTGMGIYDIKKVVEQFSYLPIHVINTHYHFDHIGGNCLFENVLGINNEYSDSVVKNGFSNLQLREYYKEDSFLNIEGFDFSKYIIKPFKVSRYINSDDEIIIEPFTFKLIHTPGHTQDSYCIYEVNNGWLFTGDTLYDGPLFISNINEYISSIEKLSNLKISKIFPGHNTFLFDKNLVEKIRNGLKKIDTDNFGGKKYEITESISIINYSI